MLWNDVFVFFNVSYIRVSFAGMAVDVQPPIALPPKCDARFAGDAIAMQ